MKRSAPYGNSDANQFASAKMSHTSTHRMQQHAGMNNFPGRPDTLPADQGHPYIASRAEGQWQVAHSLPSHPYTEAQGGNVGRSIYQGQIPDTKHDLDKPLKKEPRPPSQEQDMEIGYEDQLSPLTFEGLEKKFQDEIINLMKEQSDAEDAENARHKEKIIEINTKFLEKLSSLRAKQSSRREKFLQKETEARLQQYQEAAMSHHPTRTDPNNPHDYSRPASAETEGRLLQQYQEAAMSCHPTRTDPNNPHGNIGPAASTETEGRLLQQYQEAGMSRHPTRTDPNNPHGYGGPASAETEGQLQQYEETGMNHHPTRTNPNNLQGYSGPASAESRLPYATTPSDSFRERPSYLAGGRGQGSNGRVPFPPGRVYNKSSSHYY